MRSGCGREEKAKAARCVCEVLVIGFEVFRVLLSFC